MEAYKLGSHTVWVANSGNVTDEVWVEYIKNQRPPEPDDNFNVT
jgi:putative transposase